MICAKCRKEKGKLQVYRTNTPRDIEVCDDCYADLALNAHERSRQMRDSIRSKYARNKGLPVIEESCHS
jgi:hypothetical protein